MSSDLFGSIDATQRSIETLSGNQGAVVANGTLADTLKFLGVNQVGSFLGSISSDLFVNSTTLPTEGGSAALPEGVDPLTGEASDRIRRDNKRYEELLAAALARFGYKSIQPQPIVEVPTTSLDPLTGTRTLSGRISDDQPIVSYELGIRETSTLSATLNGLSADSDLSLWQDLNKNRLFEPEEELIFSENEGTAAESLTLNLFPGQYFLDVYQFEGNTNFNLALQQKAVATPASAIGLSLGSATNAGTLSGTDTRTGTLSPGKSDLYRFSLDRNRDFGLFLYQNSAPATLELFRDLNNNGRLDGGEMLESTIATPGQTGEIYFPQQFAGTYFARVTSAANTTYSLDLEALGSGSTGNETIETVAPGQTISGALTNTSALNPTRAGGARSQDFFLTDVVGNQKVDITVAGRNGFDPAVQIIDETTGQVVAENDNGSPTTKNAGLSFTAKPDTDYTLRVTSFVTGVSAVGDFSVSVTGSSTLAGSLGLGQSLSGSLSGSSLKAEGFYRADYNLTGVTAGQAVQLNLSSTALDPYLEVVDAASGLVVADNDDISFPNNVNSQLTFTPEAGRNYLVRVSSSIEEQVGAFTVTAAPGSNTVQRARPSLSTYLGALKSDGVRTEVQTRANDEVLDRADYLAIYQVMSADGQIDASESADLETLSRSTDAFDVPAPVLYLAGKVAGEVAAEGISASSFNDDVVGNWFLGQVRPTPTWSDTFSSATNPSTTNFTYQPVQGTLYGTRGQPIIGDLAQEPFGNCYYIAALGSTFRRQPLGPSSEENPFRGSGTSQTILDAITNNGDQTYTVRFFNSQTGRAEYVTVDQTFITNEGKIAGSTRTQNPEDPNNILWPVVMERAYAQWLGSYDKMGNGGSEAKAQGEVLGGKPTSYTNKPEENDNPGYTFEIIRDALAGGLTVTASTPKKVSLLYGSHAYTVTDAFEEGGQRYVVVFNPHGQDNGGTAGVSGDGDGNKLTPPRKDGFIRLTYEEFLSEAEDVATR